MQAIETLFPPGVRNERAPGPRGHLLLGNVPEFRGHELEYMQRLVREHGDVVRLKLGPVTTHVIAHPEGVRQVLLDPAHVYTKQTRGYDKIRALLGNGLLTSEGSFWRRQRRIAQPAFHHRAVAGFAQAMVRATTDLRDRWAVPAGAGRPVDVAADMMRLTLRIVGETLMSTDLTGDAAEVGEALTICLAEVDHRITHAVDFLERLPTPRARRFRRAAATLDGVVRRIIGERRAMTDRPPDLLTMLMEAEDEETGERMSDAQLRDEALTLLLAGHETTANALTWTLFLLSRHPAARRRLEAEVDTVLGGRAPTAADVRSLVWTRQVLEESLRLYPPAWMISRSPSRDDFVGGYRIPAGSLVFVSPWLTQRHPAVWDNPEGFDPTRFDDGTPDPKSFRWFPFGGGARICIGKAFAMMEAQLVLATLAQRWRVDLVPGHRVEPEPMVTLRPRYGMRMTVHARD